MTLFEMVRQALNDASTETELAEALAGAEILSRVVEEATWTDQQVQEALIYAPGTLKAIRRKSTAFPTPAVGERRWRRSEIQVYRRDHARLS